MLMMIILSMIISLENQLENRNKTLSAEFVNNHDRFKRQTSIKSMSPDDRPSCKPGAQVPLVRVDSSQRLYDLRQEFNSNGVNLQGVIIPSEDAHQSEFPAEYDKRRAYISGFDGSHGLAIVLKDKAALWTDGRYYTQAENQLDCNWILMKQDEPNTPTYEEWILANLGTSSSMSNRNIGLNPLFITSSAWITMDRNLKAENINLYQMNKDLVDTIWQFGRPGRPSSKIHVLEDKFSGKNWQQKVTEDVYKAMMDHKADVLIITQLDEIAWLFNLRGSDVEYNPFFMSYAILETQDGSLRIRLFLWDKLRKLTEQPSDPESMSKLNVFLNTGVSGSCTDRIGMCVEVEDYSTFINAVIATVNKRDVKKVWIPFQCNYAIYKVITKEIYQGNTPAALKKFQKNPTEQQGLRNAHKRDAVALITFAARLENQVKSGQFPVATELSAANQLDSFRGREIYNRGTSFPTLSAYGTNAAIIHYMPSLSTNVEIKTDNMYLLDSGGQYLDGTTDVTRTFHYGVPTNRQKECYTRVLMGHIDLARFIFYKGSYGPYGREIDAIARRPLWEVGLDYRHGTGHGVGAYLSVHEGPGRISLAHPRVDKDIPLDEFQVFSDEPGYYETNGFGVRIENMVMVVKKRTKYQFMDSVFLGFETLTLVPYEPTLIDFSLMSPAQIDWMNIYHNKVQREIGPLIVNDTLATAWLRARTVPVNINKGDNLKINFILLISSVCLILGMS
ncbi:xaa-Pro aminopeptidase 1-like isoform X1 [Mytilus trossulus]|uniref:xaa-Pro aminopeptidase 1-like isoform X1 n=1 Tax=Mytilus trossulus TaxID=6551 RepID=UPI0030044520